LAGLFALSSLLNDSTTDSATDPATDSATDIVTDFILDPTLARDCHDLGELHGHYLLLMDNALLPWFILVPKTEFTELCDLPADVSASLSSSVRQLSHHVRTKFPVEKLNVAAIGNVVRQLHVHVVGRHQQDFCWPGVVWGRTEKNPYQLELVEKIQADLRQELGDSFTCRQLHRAESR